MSPVSTLDVSCDDLQTSTGNCWLARAVGATMVPIVAGHISKYHPQSIAWEGDAPDCALVALVAVQFADERFSARAARCNGAVVVVALRVGVVANDVARCNRRPPRIFRAAELGATVVGNTYVMGVAVSSILVESDVAVSLSFRVARRSLFQTGHLE
jgi:hypothetical protein